MGQHEPLWNVDDLCMFLNRPKSWVHQNWRKAGIPAFKVGNELRFKPSAIEAWLDQQAQEPPQPRSRW